MPGIYPTNNGLGFAPYLLTQLTEVAKGNAPSKKITPPGFLRALLENTEAPNIINEGIDDGTGHIRAMQIKYRNRLPQGQTITTDDCNIDNVPVYKEASVNLSLFRKIGFYIDDATMSKYLAEATSVAKVNTAGQVEGFKSTTTFMQEFFDRLMEMLNGVFHDINADLTQKLAANFGVNPQSGNNNAVSVNILLDATKNNLASGMTELLTQWKENENAGPMLMVGNGIMHNYVLQQLAKGGNDFIGIDTAAFEKLYKWYWDSSTVNAFGANEIALFAADAVQFVTRARYKGFAAGFKGGSIFFTMTPPGEDSLGNALPRLELDCQLKYIDCPTQLQGPGGYAQTFNRGWALYVSKAYDLFNIPGDAYDPTDRLYGSNGTFRYLITND
ncbi:MAG TPA: hypothetical protein VFE32_17435 [Puia sp.]|jgi:hypothetical protein|nr:hypothetical protein [Puia sp.]